MVDMKKKSKNKKGHLSRKLVIIRSSDDRRTGHSLEFDVWLLTSVLSAILMRKALM